MTESSIVVIQEILSKLETADMISLASTVSQGLLRNKINTREEAMQAILNYSSNEISILRRKIITRDILFSYLHDKKIPVTLPATKNDLIEKISSTWMSPSNEHISKYSNVYDDEATQEGMCPSPLQPGMRSVTSELARQEQVMLNHIATGQSCQEIGSASDDSNMYFMAQQFSQWFYSMLNRDEPIGTEHYYPDASLKLNMFIGGQCSSETLQNNPEEISALMFQRRVEHGLYFNPNLSREGSQGRMDPHGLVMVLTCGTLHANNVCVGVFEQVFALARDPFADNNWKIKFTELNLRSRLGVSNLPTLTDSELTNNYLALSDK